MPSPIRSHPLHASPLRVVALSLAVMLALAGCGRRGPLEPPPGAVNAMPDVINDEDNEGGPDSVVPSVTPTPQRSGGKKAIQAPKEPFILDPIL